MLIAALLAALLPLVGSTAHADPDCRLGTGQWYTVNLHSSHSNRLQQYLVRDEYTQAQSGMMLIRVKSLPRGGSVSVDAYVARG